MAKRSSPSVLELLLEVVSLLPWWLGVLLAAVSYPLLHNLAAIPPAQIGTAELDAVVASSLVRSLSGVFQYVVPAVFLVAAAMSAWRRHHRKQLLDGVLHNDAQHAIQRLSWQQFEQLVGEAFRRKGYTVTETGQSGVDGGVDLVLSRGRDRVLVQCKHWRATKVSVNVVRELLGVMLAKSATAPRVRRNNASGYRAYGGLTPRGRAEPRSVSAACFLTVCSERFGNATFGGKPCECSALHGI